MSTPPTFEERRAHAQEVLTGLTEARQRGERMRSNLHTLCVAAPLVAVTVLVIAFVWYAYVRPEEVGVVGVLAVTSAVLVGLILWYQHRQYATHLKREILKPLIETAYPKTSYRPKGYISQSEFDRSGLFGNYNRYSGEDYVEGSRGATSFRFSELDVKRVTQSGKRTQTTTIFDGLYFVADFNKHFRTRTLVVPDVAENWFGEIGRTFQKLNFWKGELLQLENPEFEKAYAVYAQDQVEARYLLTPALMERILDLEHSAGNRLHLSFIDSQVHVAIKTNHNYFAAKLSQSLLDDAPLLAYLHELETIVSIVDDLDLNTRIWTKE